MLEYCAGMFVTQTHKFNQRPKLLVPCVHLYLQQPSTCKHQSEFSPFMRLIEFCSIKYKSCWQVLHLLHIHFWKKERKLELFSK